MECSNLADISLPESLTSIESCAFRDCKSLAKVTCYASNPPKLDFDSFDWQGVEHLYVPANRVQAYKNSDWSRQFKNILPIE